MSLTSQLHAGELGRWAAARLPGTAQVAAEVTAAAGTRPPVRPAGRVDASHWADVGGAHGARLGALVEASPPYYALYGLVRAGIVRRSWADAQAAGWSSHAALDPERAREALEWRPSPTGWIHQGTATVDEWPATPDEAPLADLLARLRAYHDAHAPVGAVGSPAVETTLSRAYALVSAWEGVYRSGGTSAPQILHDLHGGPVTPSAEAMLAAVPAAIVADQLAILRAQHDAGLVETLHELAGRPPAGEHLGHAGPVLVPHWADADIVVGRTLLDVKTVIRADDAERVGRWLWQILGYQWLDAQGAWRIERAGLLLARHALVVAWDVDELIDRLTGEPTPAARARTRAEFLGIVRRVATAEGAVLPD